MLHTVKKVDYVDGYRLRLHFNDRKVKIVDLEKMIKKVKNMFLPLVDIEYFKSVTCDGTTICWPNGVDLCPDVLYSMGESFSQEPRKRKKSQPKSKARRKVKPRA
jgi:hypothetical protein